MKQKSFLGFLGFVLLIFLTVPYIAFAEEGWTLTNKGYKVWDANPHQPKDTVNWSGDADSKGFITGFGILQWFIDGKAGERFEELC